MYGNEAEVIHGPWILFEDRRGKGVAQPDSIIIPHNPDLPIVVVECKLTYKEAAKAKLRRLYWRLAKLIWPGRRIYCIQVCRAFPWGLDTDLLKLRSLNGLLTQELDKAYYVVHHI